MIDAARDEMVPFKLVARRFPQANGKPRSFKTIMRWILHGAKPNHHGGVPIKLEAIRVGGTWFTTEDALREFSRGLTDGAMPPAKIPEPRQPTASHLRAMANLRAKGIIK